MRNVVLTGVALSALVSLSSAEWKELQGKAPPPINARQWLHVKESPTLDSLRGKVWLLEFFASG